MSQTVQVSVNISIPVSNCTISQAHCSLHVLLFKFGLHFSVSYLRTVIKVHTYVYFSNFLMMDDSRIQADAHRISQDAVFDWKLGTNIINPTVLFLFSDIFNL